MNKIKVLIIGDSSVMPRDELCYIDTYVHHLVENHNDLHIINKAQRGHTVLDIFSHRKDYLINGFFPNCVIFHYGIVDAYPRPIPSGRKINHIYQLLAYIKIDLSSILKKLKLYYLFSNLFNFKTVEYSVFKNRTYELVELAKQNGAKQIIFIGIVKSTKVLNKVKIAEQEIIKYNDVFKNLALEQDNVFYVDNFDLADEDTLWDGHHYTKTGMYKLYNKIIKILKK